MHFVNNVLGKNFFSIQTLVLKLLHCTSFLLFMQIFDHEKKNFSQISYIPSFIGSQFLWFSNYTTSDSNHVHVKEFSSHNINFFSQSFTLE